MFSLIAIFFFSFWLGLSGALMPGPLLMVTIAHAGRVGSRAGPLVVMGHAFPELAVVILVMGGFGTILSSPGLKGFIFLAGGVLLLFMGIGMIRSRVDMKTSSDNEPSKFKIGPVLSGTVASISNPYWTLWWATVGLGYMTAALSRGWLGLVLFFAGHISADLIWYSMVSYGVARGKNWISPRFYTALVAGCGFFLVVFGGWFFYSGVGVFLTP